MTRAERGLRDSAKKLAYALGNNLTSGTDSVWYSEQYQDGSGTNEAGDEIATALVLYGRALVALMKETSR
jgi:hypothetical protein